MSKHVFIAFITAIMVLPSRSFATLGQREESCEQDRAALNGQSTEKAQNSYLVHTIQANGDVIKEYVSPVGTVFAITWRGLAHPNLSVLLGEHYAEFIAIAAKTPASQGRAPIGIQTSRAVVLRGGHMRDVHGRAYAPELVPSGVNPEDLQ
jgi:hypothetical protein